MLARRHFLQGAVAKCLNSDRTLPALRDIGKRNGILFGSEITCLDIADQTYRDLISRHCAIVTPGLEAKWLATEPAEGDFRFTPLDRIVVFAQANGLALHMHNLIWSSALPQWTKRALAEGRGQLIMQRHIDRVAGRYSGQVYAWDAVNEPVDPRWPSGEEGLCNTEWRRSMGSDYIPMALQAAAKADPDARLLINDDDLEYDTSDRERKRTIYLRLIESWLKSGVPLHGFGLEAHLKPWLPFAEGPYRRFLHELAELGLKLYITELDVCDRLLPAESAMRDAATARIVADYLNVALDEPAVRAVMVWGLSDRATYMNTDPGRRRPDGLPSRPCAFDAALRPKPMYFALANALKAAPSR